MSNFKDEEISIDARELHEFANLFCENINEELDLLNREEEVLMFLKNDLKLNSNLEDALFESNKFQSSNLTSSKEIPVIPKITKRHSGAVPMIPIQPKRNKHSEIKIKK